MISCNIKQKSFALLFFIFILTFLTLFLFVSWYRTNLLLDLVEQRESFYKNFYLNNLFLKYGLCLAKNNYEIFFLELTKSKKNINLSLNNLLNYLESNKNNNFNIQLLISKNKENKLIINTVLLKDNRLLSSQSCLLEKCFEKTDNGKEKIYFVTKYFTLDNNF